jgi:hypothetical protein
MVINNNEWDMDKLIIDYKKKEKFQDQVVFRMFILT